MILDVPRFNNNNNNNNNNNKPCNLETDTFSDLTMQFDTGLRFMEYMTVSDFIIIQG